MDMNVFNLIILDASGSMYSIKKQAVDGVNETIQTIKSAQKKDADMKQFVSFVSFNSDATRVVYDRVLADKVTELSPGDYVPNCATPLYDAVGTAVTNLRDYVTDKDTVLVTIITDGYENCSREFTGKIIYELIGELRKKGWVFTYIGANQDVEQVAKEMNIQNAMAYEATPTGAKQMFSMEHRSRGRFFDRLKKLKAGEMSQKEFDEAAYFDRE